MLAATLSPSYGIYSGYEHFENVAVREGSRGVPTLGEVRAQARTLDGPLLPMVQRINTIRRENPALQELSNITFLDTANDALIGYAKQPGQHRHHDRQHRSPPGSGGPCDLASPSRTAPELHRP